MSSGFDRRHFESRDAWQAAVGDSEVRLQWDPDHHPHGAREERRAIQLGLRGSMLKAFGTSEMLEVIDMAPFVAEQRALMQAGRMDELRTPRETVYRPADPRVV